MRPIFAQGNSRTLQRLKRLGQEAQTEKAPRVALRLQAIMLSVQGQTSGQIAQGLPLDRTRVHAWIGAWNEDGDEGLLEGQRSGRPAAWNDTQQERLGDILDSGPVAHGLNTGVWTSPLIAQILEEECDVRYHPGHVRRLLKQLDFSVQRPKTRLVQADPKKQNRWIRYTHPNLKKNARREGAVIVYEAEASFRQTPTLYRTWARRGQQPPIPTRGERHPQKILGAVSVPEGDFVWRHPTEDFNAQTYLAFVDGDWLPHFYRRRHRL
jgi:transposase